MSELPPLSSQRAFEAVARHKNLTRAGADLNVTHSAVSQQIRRLETFIGFKLIARTNIGIELTEAGDVLGQGLISSFSSIHRAIDLAKGNDERQPVSVNMTSMLSAEWLGPRLGRFRRHFPNIGSFGIKVRNATWQVMFGRECVPVP